MCPIKELQFLDFLGESVDSPSLMLTYGYHRKLNALQSTIKNTLVAEIFNREDLERLELYANAALTEKFDFDWYRSFFETVPEGRKVVEVAPTYSYAKETNIGQFARFLGKDTRIIFFLRNPVDRWLSLGRFDFKLMFGQDGLDDRNIPYLAGAIELGWNRNGGYRENIETWEKYFSNLYFIFHEDLHANDGSGLVQFCDFLNVPADADQFDNIEERVNSQGVEDFPLALRTWVSSQRMDELVWMADRFGGPAEKWRQDALSLVDS